MRNKIKQTKKVINKFFDNTQPSVVSDNLGAETLAMHYSSLVSWSLGFEMLKVQKESSLE